MKLLERRRSMMRSGSGIDWESIARGMVDNTYAFDITGVEVNPTRCLFVDRKLMTGVVTIKSGVGEIGANCFDTCESITEVVMPNSITKINNNAFTKCLSLTSVNISSALTQLNSYAFMQCKLLTSLSFPATLTTIQAQSIVQNAALTELIFESTTPPSYGANAIYQNNALTAIYVPDASVSAYQAESGWSTYASIIKGISQRPSV
jgi:hypothetical protein